VNLGQLADRVGGDDRAAQQRVGGFVGLPDRPQPGREQGLGGAAVHEERRLRGFFAGGWVRVGPPFVIAVHRNQAALGFGAGAEGRRGGDLVGARVDQQWALVL